MRKRTTTYKFTHLLLMYSVLAIYAIILSAVLTGCGSKENPAVTVEEDVSAPQDTDAGENTEEFSEPTEYEEQKNTDMTLDEALQYEMLGDVDSYHIYESVQIIADAETDDEWVAPFFYSMDAAVDAKNGKMWAERIGGTDGFECYYEYDLENDKKDCVKYSDDFELVYTSDTEVPSADEYMLRNCFTEDVSGFFEDFANKYDAQFAISDTLETIFFNSFEGYVDESPCYVVTIKCDTDTLEKELALPEGALKDSVIKAYISRDTNNFELRFDAKLPVFTDEEAAVFRATYACDDELLKKEAQYSYTFAFTDIDRVDFEYYLDDSGSYFLQQIAYEGEVDNG